jgi:uncharacterized RDD family membrane protein YckC
MTTGLAATGSTHHPTGGDPALPGQLCATDCVVDPAVSTSPVETLVSETKVPPNTDSWRDEVAARLERYRTRRKPRTPRYPSLLLPFDAPESWSRSAPPTVSAAVARTAPRHGQNATFDLNDGPTAVGTPDLADLHQASQQASDLSAKVLEFPRSAAIPVFHRSELADPVFDFDRPRIVEAPEILPPPPALGGMLIESIHEESTDRRAEFPSASPSASIARRALAALVDGIVLTTALTSFSAIFLRLNPSLNPLHRPIPLLGGSTLTESTLAKSTLAGALGAVTVLLWVVYLFLFVVYTGSTPGLRVARLQLAAFDGSPLNRRSRRWRVLASFLSAFSAGLGYLWCVLDQDGLCWHDRITRSHVQSAAQPE